MQLKTIIDELERLAPPGSQESYDNSGLITGNPGMHISGALISLDCTEEIVDEAIEKGCNLVIAHHPIVFAGMKKLTGRNYVERTVIKAIRNDVAIYAIHTNLDNFRGGVNLEICERIGVLKPQILAPKPNTLEKLVVFVPETHVQNASEALFEAGAGHIGNYDRCSFKTSGTGTFRPLEGSDPFQGKQGETEQSPEVRLEVLVSKHRRGTILKALFSAHPYEEVAYDLIPLSNVNPFEGSGMVGELETELDEREFLSRLKTVFGCGVIRHTHLSGKPVKRVAVCGGSGSFLLEKAKAAGADFFVTGDFKYHEFFDAENQIVIADIGHYESEQFTTNLLAGILKKKFTNFAVHLTGLNTNPINYF